MLSKSQLSRIPKIMFYTTKTVGCASIEEDITPFHKDINILETEQWQMMSSDDEGEIIELMVNNMVSTVNNFLFTNRLTRQPWSDNIGSITGFKDASCMKIDVQVNYLFTLRCL